MTKQLFVLVLASMCACNSSSGANADANSDAVATCSAPGEPTPGPADDHCGNTVQTTNPASCNPSTLDTGASDGAGDSTATTDMGGAGADCPYNATMFGQQGDDDDCKYHVEWASSALCEGAPGVFFTVVATNKTDGSALTGAGAVAEVFTTTPGDASCDDQSTHPGPNSPVSLAEGPPGTYTGRIEFDASGQWTVRFHFFETCADLLPDSPHGHAAFRFTLP